MKYEITEKQQELLTNNFTYHAPKDDQSVRYTLIRDQAKSLAQTIMENTPYSREQSTALTQLETAIFWANAAIARNE